jgi:hypothetical protein
MAWDLQNMSEANGYCKPIRHKKWCIFRPVSFLEVLLSGTMGNNEQTIRIFLDTISWF